MEHFRKLEGELCYLSPLGDEDGRRWAEWLNDTEVALPLGDEVFQVLGRSRMEEAARETQSRMDPVFTILDRKTDKPLGRIMLFGLCRAYGTANLGVFIGEKEYWSGGYGTDAIRLMLDYGFNMLNLHHISLGVFAFNERAIRCYEKAGFKVIGRRREARRWGNRYYDALLMDILASEYESVFFKEFMGEAYPSFTGSP